MIMNRCLRFLIGVLAGLGFSSPGFAQNGYVGIYADAQGTTPCTTVPPYMGTTLYVIATLQGTSANGITGAEFRIEVSNPSGWYFSYSAPTGTTTIGTVLDTDPANPDDGSGFDIVFSACQQPAGGKVSMGTLGVFNLSGGPTSLAVKRHSSPPNPDYACPLFVLCDDPAFSKSCMSSGSEPACTLQKPAGLSIADQAVFVAGLNVVSDEGNGEPGPPRPMTPDSLVQAPMLVGSPTEPDIVGLEGVNEKVRGAEVLADTTWVTDWNFDATPPNCNQSGWTTKDNLVRNDGPYYGPPCTGSGPCVPWQISTAYAGTGYIANKAEVLKADGCWTRPGYGNGWDYAVKLKYKGTGSKLSFDYLLGSEPGYDFLFVEADSASASDSLVDYHSQGQRRSPSYFRTGLRPAESGTKMAGHIVLLGLPDFGQPNVDHSVYIRFASDRTSSDEDGLFDSPIDAGLVVDNVSVSGGLLNYSEDFEGATLNGNVSLINSARSKPFGFGAPWARLYSHVTDNEKCAENTTCSWLFTDPTFIGVDATVNYGPGAAIIHNWLDDTIISPWVSLTQSAKHGMVLSFREFGGNKFVQSKIARSLAIRGMKGSCVTKWSDGGGDPSKSTWQNLDYFNWVSWTYDLSQFFDFNWDKVQVRFRVGDWQALYGATPPLPPRTGPGPYIDRVRLGRVAAGPVIYIGPDTRFQAQDAFPTVQNGILPGEHFSPTTDRFVTCAFSMGYDLGIPPDEGLLGSQNLITGDSVVAEVVDRSGSGIHRVGFYYRVVAGPHVGKMVPLPPGYGTEVLMSNGLVKSEKTYNPGEFLAARTFAMDFDDTYFRGGDVLQYFWYAEAFDQTRMSYPPGLTQKPEDLVDITAAEQQTGGLFEVNFLPKINWAAAYVARIASDPTGDIDPTSTELANSYQANCILYVNKANTDRRSSQRTSFMFTLDRLGYKGAYDVYDLQGFGNTNNDLGGRATPSQAKGYALVVHDVGRSGSATIPDGLDQTSQKINQAQWYRDYLANGSLSEVGTASLWAIGENWAFEKKTNFLVATDMAISTNVTDDQSSLATNPNVEGQTFFTFANGAVSTFTGDTFSLSGGCPATRAYDGFTAGGTGVTTHKYKTGSTLGNGAVVMNRNISLHWNTIGMGFNWFDMRYYCGVTPCPTPTHPTPWENLATKVLAGVLPTGCHKEPTDVPPGEQTDALPKVSALYQNVPNPFNPTTTIRFDLADKQPVKLRVFDIKGGLVRTLVDGVLPRQRHSLQWNGLNEAGRRVASGVYFYRLEAGGFLATRKLVILK